MYSSVILTWKYLILDLFELNVLSFDRSPWARSFDGAIILLMTSILLTHEIPGLGTEIKMNIDINFSINVIHVLNIDINFGITEIHVLNIDINFDI